VTRIAAIATIALLPALAGADATFAIRQLTPQAAQKAAQAALAACQAAGYQVTVVVADRAGLPQVLLRDRYAGAHTIEVATNKAWSAASFRIPTAQIERSTKAASSMGALRNVPRVTAIAGGLPIEAAGVLLGAIGVSGAPGGEADDACAAAGIKAIAEELEL
jgi:uncharacterized protein GlcG (DUF336 family)